MPKLYATGICLALGACLCAGCAGSNATPPRTVQTSYPSPDYPVGQTEPAAPAPIAAPAPAPAETAPQGRPLYGPVGTTAPSAPAAPAAAPARPAQPGRPAGAPNLSRLFEVMDTDHNGRITLEEWRNFHEREFRRLDKNDDGVLSREEMTAPPALPGPGRHPAP